MEPAVFREGVGPPCSESVFCFGLLPASATYVLSDCRPVASPGSVRGPQSECGCQLAEATSNRTGAKDSAVLRVSLCVWENRTDSMLRRVPAHKVVKTFRTAVPSLC